jgi:nitrite reductase (NAD(P)H)
VPVEQVIPILDRYLALYIRTADRLQRTARWIESLPAGIKYLREVILEDKLGICAALEKQMDELVSSYFCEWTETVRNPERRAQFKQFANADATIDWIEPMTEREQQRPSNWPKDAASVNFRDTKWSSMEWESVLQASKLKDLPTGDSVQIKRGGTQLAVFKVSGKYYCTQQMCPHKRAFVLSDGLLGQGSDSNDSKIYVSCPLHKRNFELNGESSGKCSNDDDLSIATFEVEERPDGWLYAKLPPAEELDAVLGTGKWMVKHGETPSQFEELDRKVGKKGRKGVRANGVQTIGHLNGQTNGEAKAKDDGIVVKVTEGIDW